MFANKFIHVELNRNSKLLNSTKEYQKGGKNKSNSLSSKSLTWPRPWLVTIVGELGSLTVWREREREREREGERISLVDGS